jgi:phosphoglycerate dehydrogenase-like enzyme
VVTGRSAPVSRRRSARVWLGPAQPLELRAAVLAGGGIFVPQPEANVFVWATDGTAIRSLRDGLTPVVEWVQLDSAGVDDWLRAGIIDSDRSWTGAQGVYAPDVAEHVVGFILAAAKRLAEAAQRRTWSDLEEARLLGRTVGIVGGGGIARETIRRLRPFGVRTLVVSRSGRRIAGATEVVPAGQLRRVLPQLDYLVLAAPLTPATQGMIGMSELSRLPRTAWIVNVGRGGLLDTDALIAALDAGHIGGACLDVTDPEPLPDGHPLWGRANVIITPHVANPWAGHFGPLAQRVQQNMQRFVLGRPLLGVVDTQRGY